MNNSIQNPERSLELVVFAPMLHCLRALRSLERGGIFAHEKVTVETHAIKHELYEFEVKLTIRRTKSRNRTVLRGIMHYDSKYNTTKVVASVPKKHTEFAMLVSAALFGVITGVVLNFFSDLSFLVLLFIVVYPTNLWILNGIDKNDTHHLLDMVEQALLLVDSRKPLYFGDRESVETPFYGDMDDQKKKKHVSY